MCPMEVETMYPTLSHSESPTFSSIGETQQSGENQERHLSPEVS